MSRQLCWFACACLATTLAAQAPVQPKTEGELGQQVIQTLVGFARSAETWKAPSRARAVYRTILDHYDGDNASARTGLGWKKVKGEWQLATSPDKLPADTATPAQTKLVDDAWRIASKRVAALHKTFALALDGSGDHVRAAQHLERALAFTPDDAECHRALGHAEVDGFFGTDEQIAFVKRFRALLAKVREIAAVPIEVEAVPNEQMPVELRRTGFAFVGARCKHATWWVVGTASEARNCAVWNERAVLLLQQLVGDDPETNRYVKQAPMRWLAVMRTDDQRARLLGVSPLTRGDESLERALRYDGQYFTSESGEAAWMCHEDHDDDYVVGFATKFGAPWSNPGLSEGLVHTMTWLLCGTLECSFMRLPATAAGNQEELPLEPAEWLRELRAEIDKGEDWPLVNVPRETMENFRHPVRFKAWSFVGWLLARHPDRWLKLMVELGYERRTPEDVTAICEKVLERKLADVEAEWREWARAGSRIGKASGLPQ